MLALGEVFKARSALLKHEVAYVMGQLADQHSATVLTEVLKVRTRRRVLRATRMQPLVGACICQPVQ